VAFDRFSLWRLAGHGRHGGRPSLDSFQTSEFTRKIRRQRRPVPRPPHGDESRRVVGRPVPRPPREGESRRVEDNAPYHGDEPRRVVGRPVLRPPRGTNRGALRTTRPTMGTNRGAWQGGLSPGRRGGRVGESRRVGDNAPYHGGESRHAVCPPPGLSPFLAIAKFFCYNSGVRLKSGGCRFDAGR